MLGFLDAGPLCFPVLISQCESNWENLTEEIQYSLCHQHYLVTKEDNSLNKITCLGCLYKYSTLEWAGPCSQSSLYSGWILLKRANSFTKHMGVFSLGFAMLDTGTSQRKTTNMMTNTKLEFVAIPKASKKTRKIWNKHVGLNKP